jgi:hypothetical protein
LIKDGQLIGVLDIDSSILNRFDSTDSAQLESIVAFFMRLTSIPHDLSNDYLKSSANEDRGEIK